MSEIEKMYENANIKAKEYCDRDSDACMICCPEWENRQNCWKYKSAIPPFTAEKQIEIIKFLISKHARFDMFKNYEQKDLYMVHYECRYFPKQYLPFGEALAESINYLWQSLTEKEKRQITDILK